MRWEREREREKREKTFPREIVRKFRRRRHKHVVTDYKEEPIS